MHKVIGFDGGPLNCKGFDDELEFNTQCSSQWDSLVHFNHQPTGTGYNGVIPTVEELIQEFGNTDKDKKLPTLNRKFTQSSCTSTSTLTRPDWHERGGLVARGVLIDFRAYAEKNGIKYSPFDGRRITIKEIETIAKEQGVTFKQGDVIIIRSGFTEDLGEMDGDQQNEAMGSHRATGVEGTEDAAAWFWNKHFAAVAGDAIAFEAIPPIVNGKEADVAQLGTLTMMVSHARNLMLIVHQFFTSTSLVSLACQ